MASVLGNKRKIYDIPANMTQPGGGSRSVGNRDRLRSEQDVELAEPMTIAGGHGTDSATKALSAKQTSVSFLNPTSHTAKMTCGDSLLWRGDAAVTFATSIAANQPVASVLDRAKGFTRTGIIAGETKWTQFLEVEGRALPCSAYFHSYIAQLIQRTNAPAGIDSALANTTEGYGLYHMAGFFGYKDSMRVENIIKSAPYTGVGAVSAYTEDDGISGTYRSDYGPLEPKLGDYYVARSFGSNISSVNASGVRAFMLAAPNDIDSGFTIKVGGRAYTPEEINDIEDRINLYLYSNQYSILFGAYGAAVRGPKPSEDPFTGASVFLLSDVFKTPRDLEIVISTAQSIQLVVLSDDGIGCMTT